MKPTAPMMAALLVGAASAAPAYAERAPECPEMPASRNSERSSAGGLTLQFGGFGVGGEASRSHSSADIFMSNGGFEAWSAAVLLAHTCALNRRIYRGDLTAQREALITLRDRLLRQYHAARAGEYGNEEQQPATSNAGVTYGWTWSQMWRPLATRSFMPYAATSAGVTTGSAEVDCLLSRTNGLSDCYVIAESPRSYGFGNAAVRYLSSLRLADGPLSYSWADRRLRRTVTLSIDN